MLLARVRPAAPVADIYPLAASAAEALVGTMPLAQLQEAEARAAGLTVVDVVEGSALPAETAIACGPAAVFSRETLIALRAAAHSQGRVVQAGIAPGTALFDACTRLGAPAQALPFPLWAGALAGESLAGHPIVAVCDEADHDVIRVPPHGRAPHTLRLPRVLRLGGVIVHWLDVLELSLAALRTVLRRERLADTRNQIGDADIHPTAYVSGSIIEDGARIEANASVIGSYLGKDAHIADHSVVVDCVLGPDTRTLVDTSLRRVVAFGDCTLSNLAMQDALFGKGVFLTTGVSFFGPDPGHDVVVDGVDTHRAVLGGAVGARAILGARALLVAGTAIPPGALVVARPDEAVGKFDAASLARAHMQIGDRSSDV